MDKSQSKPGVLHRRIFMLLTLVLWLGGCKAAPPTDFTSFQIQLLPRSESQELVAIEVDRQGCYAMTSRSAKIAGCLPNTQSLDRLWKRLQGLDESYFSAVEADTPRLALIKDGQLSPLPPLAPEGNLLPAIEALIIEIESANQTPIPGPEVEGGWQLIEVSQQFADKAYTYAISSNGRWRCSVESSAGYSALHGVLESPEALLTAADREDRKVGGVSIQVVLHGKHKRSHLFNEEAAALAAPIIERLSPRCEQ